MKAVIRILVNLFLAICVLWAWIGMIMGQNGMFMSVGLASLKWFTVLSNLLEAAASIVWIFLHRSHRKAAETFKYIACVSVALTFTTVMVFLGPLFGYGSMFVGVTLWMHLIVPAIAFFEFILMGGERMGRQENLLAVLPMLAYGIFYLANNLINGRGEWPATNDWYGFLTWGFPVGTLIFAVIVLVTYLLGFLVQMGQKKFSGETL